jgi:cytochrome c oxidase assembly protein subunit 15
MKKVHSSVRNWLWIGIFMTLVQIVLGGITRLTGSGLSITEWNVVMGALPPLNEAQWLDAFHKYQQIPQYKVLNSNFTLSDFKGIFFWEYFHRLWARSISLVFLIPFIYFIVKKRITKQLWIGLGIAFLLGAVQGLVGWVMVKSGLTDDHLWVSPLKLSLHLLTALILLSWMIRITLQYGWQNTVRIENRKAKNISLALLIGLFVQIGLGGLMAGSHAATYFPTWPDMNGQAIPQNLLSESPLWMNFMDNMATIQFFHRGTAYVLFFCILGYAAYLFRKYPQQKAPKQFALALISLAVLQVLLGIFTLLGSASGTIPVVLGVLHQSVGLLLFSVMLTLYLYFRKTAVAPAEKIKIEEEEPAYANA